MRSNRHVVGVAAYTTFSVEQTNLLPAVFTAIVAGLRLLPSANLIVKSISQSWYSRDAASRLSKEFIKLAQESDTVNANEASSKIFNSLELRQFRPDAAFLNQPLEISRRFDFGQLVAIFGPSGSGKTTLLDAISGLIGSTGDLSIDGNKTNPKLLRERNLIFYLSQKPYIFKGTLRENLCFGLQNIEQISAAELKDTLLAVNGAGVLEKFNGDFDSLIDPTTSHLSGGEIQKIALCRVLLSERRIILLDEATSALDKKSQLKFFDSLKKLKPESLTLFVTHSEELKNISDAVIEFG